MKMQTIKLFKDSGLYNDDVFVGVNGKSYLIQRGVEVSVPYFVAEILQNSAIQEELAKKTVQDIQDRYNKSVSK